MPNLDPHLLRAALSVAELGTVSAAAAALHRTQAAVSMQLRRLESALGATLFERSPRGLTLTDAGRDFLPYAREMLTLNDEACRRLDGRRMRGRVRLGAVEDFAATRLVEMLRGFRDLNPQVQIDLIIDGNRGLAERFTRGRLELLICDVGRLERQPLRTWHEVLPWVVRNDLGTSLPQAPLPVVMFEQGCAWRASALRALQTHGVPWTLACEASTLVAMATAVRVGIGIGPMVPATIPPGCRALQAGEGAPPALEVDIGLYAAKPLAEPARHLAAHLARAPEPWR